MHQCVDLQLGVVERVQGGFLHVPVDRLTHPGVEAHLGISNTEIKNEMRTRVISHKLLPSDLRPANVGLWSSAAEQHCRITAIQNKATTLLLL